MAIALLLIVLLWFRFALSADIAKCTGDEWNLGPSNPLASCGYYGYDETWIIATQKNYSSASGYAEWMTVNGTWPPPTIKITTGQRIRIRLVNNLPNSYDESVTLHFHGILQENGYVVMDGPQGVVQTGVRPGAEFIYDFPVKQAGTYWIHSHAPGQYPKGLRSPLIVTDSTEPAEFGYNSTLDFTTTVSDWWPDFWHAERLYRYNSCGGKGYEYPPTRVTINDQVPEWGVNNRRDTYVIPPNSTARLRIINTSAFAQFYVFASDQRPFQVIELDGVKVTGPKTVRGFSVASGQRISVLFKGGSSADSIARIYFISEPRIAGGDELCKLTPTNSDNGALAQFTQLFINASPGPQSNSVDMNDFDDRKSDGTLEKRRWLKEWVECSDTYATPYFSRRLKVPMGYEKRPGSLTACAAINPKATVIHAPTDVFGFTDTYFQAKDGTAPWKVPKATEDYIHQISIRDHQGPENDPDNGRGEMGSTIDSPDPNNLFKLRDSYNSYVNWNSPLPPLTTLQYVLFKENYAEIAKKSPKSYADGGNGAQTLVLPNRDEVHWLVVRTTRGDHPIHLHGHEFQILARIPAGTHPSGASKNFAEDGVAPNGWPAFVDRINGLATAAPVRRDTIMIERGWTYVLAIKASNPGVWALHCHNDFHASTGMFMQVVEAPLDLRRELGTWTYTKADDPTCFSGFGLKMTISDLGRKSQALPPPPGFRLPSGPNVLWDPYKQLLTKSLEWWTATLLTTCVRISGDESFSDPRS